MPRRLGELDNVERDVDAALSSRPEIAARLHLKLLLRRAEARRRRGLISAAEVSMSCCADPALTLAPFCSGCLRACRYALAP